MTALKTPLEVSRPRRAAPIRVLLVDDSRVARSIFKRVLGAHPAVSVVAEAEDCDQALAVLATERVDIILLDIEMPNRSGIEALPEIISAAGSAKVIVVSSFAEKNGPAALKALSLGACDTLAKPGRTTVARGGFSEALLEKVLRLGSAPAMLLNGSRAGQTDVALELGRPECLAIGASTGGIPVIFEIVSNLDASLQCPIFIVQHLPEAFMDFFARQLQQHTDRPVSVALDGQEVQPGHVYVAPGGAHLVCRRIGQRIILNHLNDSDASPYCPSVDVLFNSVANVFGSDAVAVVLSGMGNDGVTGARQMQHEGAAILVQDEASAVVWGMPGAIVREQLEVACLSPKEIIKALHGAGAR